MLVRVQRCRNSQAHQENDLAAGSKSLKVIISFFIFIFLAQKIDSWECMLKQ